jgi:hypothetical protein
MRSFLAAMAALAVLAPVAHGASLERAKGPCPPRKAKATKVLARTPQAVVWKAKGQTFACWRSNKRVWTLGRTATLPQLSGERVAYGAGAVVRVATLPTGDTVDAGPVVETGRAVTIPKVTALVLRGDGVAAWIGQGTSDGTPIRQVRQTGGLMATGMDIEATSLKLAGDRVEWTQYGIPRSAPLG